jgi:hypothetical protein
MKEYFLAGYHPSIAGKTIIGFVGAHSGVPAVGLSSLPLPAKRNGGNAVIPAKPVLDVNTLRALEEALENFAGALR